MEEKSYVGYQCGVSVFFLMDPCLAPLASDIEMGVSG